MKANGENAIPNPNSAAIWHYSAIDRNKNGKMDFEETMHRTIGSVAIKDDLLYISDFAGLIHCLDAKKSEDGKPVVYWTDDTFSAAWGSVLIVDNKVYIGDEDGDISIFKLSAEMEMIGENNMGSSVYTTPVIANDTMFIANRNRLYAIKEGASSKPAK